MTSVVMPGLVAGVIYFIIAFATGASAVASIIGGIVVRLGSRMVDGSLRTKLNAFRAVYKRRAGRPHE